MTLLLIALAGGVGAATRFVLDGVINARWSAGGLRPGIVVINVVGSFLLGLLVGLAARGSGLSTDTVAVLGLGFCGGLTTFSTASLEPVHLWATGERGPATAYVLVTLIGSLLAAWLGLALAALA
ncbi:MAG: fluoride efflux transporter CrcB [Intrasporangiaceae bacterium]|nr:fluoride efflux transporter CrcB [Intrasporangiaceae bacterium]